MYCIRTVGQSVMALDPLVKFFLACVVLLHDDLFLVAAEHGQVGFYVHGVVDPMLKSLQSHLMHFIQNIPLHKIEAAWPRCLERHPVKLCA